MLTLLCAPLRQRGTPIRTYVRTCVGVLQHAQNTTLCATVLSPVTLLEHMHGCGTSISGGQSNHNRWIALDWPSTWTIGVGQTHIHWCPKAYDVIDKHINKSTPFWDFSAIVQAWRREAFEGTRGEMSTEQPTRGLPGIVGGRQSSRGGRAEMRGGVCGLSENTQLLPSLFCTQRPPCKNTHGSFHKQNCFKTQPLVR